MKKVYLLVVCVVIVFLINGCGSDNLVQKDLLNYINVELPKVAEIENKVVSGYDAVSGENYTDDLTMYNALKDEILGDSLELIEKTESIEIKTEDVKDVHEIYIEAINMQHQAFTKILAAVEAQDIDKVTEANKLLSDARKRMREFSTELIALQKENNIVSK